MEHTAWCGGYGEPNGPSTAARCTDALQSRNPGSSPLSDDLLRACRGLLGMGFDAPQHLYSHRVGTFLDALLHHADGVAKRQAKGAWPRVGWI